MRCRLLCSIKSSSDKSSACSPPIPLAIYEKCSERCSATTVLSLSNLPSMDKCISLFLLSSLSSLSQKGLKDLKKFFGLLFRSCDISVQYCFMAIHLCHVALFLHFLLSSKFCGVFFWLYLSANLRLALMADFHAEVI